MRFLFWNIGRRPLLTPITDLVHTHEVDILIIAESELSDIEMLRSLNSRGVPCFTISPPGVPGLVKIYSHLSWDFIRPIRDSRGVAIRQIAPPVGNDLILVAVHLPSKLHQTEQDQVLNCTRLSRMIEEVEKEIGHTRTLVMGDLNMNPFECGMIGAEGIHAISDRVIASKGTRRVAGEDRRFFYNPMWNCFGDGPPGPPGTYFYDTGTQVNMYWNIFDQVLMRPELITAFSDENLRIITELGSRSLLSPSGRPDQTFGSDHLPILLSLRL